ncbi:hypothetical protein SDRG_00898 [Saprolegnia diclina VS20]|uniref:ABC transporter domain-containing protein n=2 Tax=Saprolegnia TaxID=4769 RepID=T0R6H7_SAPDV|nr:hypothetical protein SDRG_00898 [Saprolegnia diclina VS20]EQC42055.1 hypothetical protein SDRG_00898 [Saprolegnia diclina VS20]|eukprot:XP_008604624.1 hypothetical protein SDRG_00898 [Saprolegnia diclina VS20]
MSSEAHYIDVATPKAGADILVDVPKITLEWKNVSKVVKIKNTATKQVEDKVILNDLSGIAVPGELVVMMGPSGAGKSSLLDVISGRQKDYTGSVLANGQKWTKQMNKYASYVMQDDVFYETLTPIYNGKASDAVEYFASQGYQCPNYMNPTDYFMRQMIVLDTKSEAAARVDKLVANWRARSHAIGNNGDVKDDSDGSSDASDTVYESSHLGTFGSMRVLCKRNVTRLVRDSLAFKARLGQSIIISVVVGLIFRQLELSQTGIQSFTGAIFFIVVNQFFSATTPEFASVPLELPIMKREYNGGLYRSYVWYIAKNVSELVMQFFFPLIFLIPVYFMVGFGASNAGLFFTFYLFIALLSSSATGLGYMVSCIAKTPEIAPIIGILIILPFLIFGGLFINTNNVPVYFRWLEFISPMKYAFRGMCRAFWNSIDTIPCDAAVESCVATTGAQVLANLGLDKKSMGYDIIFLVWINLLFRFIGIVALWITLRKKN